MSKNESKEAVLGLNDQMLIRRQRWKPCANRESIPFGHRFERSCFSQEIIDHFDTMEGKTVSVAGRIMSVRGHGKVSFMELSDLKGTIQLFFKIDAMEEESFKRIKLLDIGDIIGVTGEVFRTQRGQISVRVATWGDAFKSLRPLPEKNTMV